MVHHIAVLFEPSHEDHSVEKLEVYEVKTGKIVADYDGQYTDQRASQGGWWSLGVTEEAPLNPPHAADRPDLSRAPGAASLKELWTVSWCGRRLKGLQLMRLSSGRQPGFVLRPIAHHAGSHDTGVRVAADPSGRAMDHELVDGRGEHAVRVHREVGQ